jgi:PAS domain S-box-containing protein
VIGGLYDRISLSFFRLNMLERPKGNSIGQGSNQHLIVDRNSIMNEEPQPREIGSDRDKASLYSEPAAVPPVMNTPDAPNKGLAVFTINNAGLITGWSEKAAALFGYEGQDILRRPFSVLYSEDERTAGSPNLHIKDAAEQGQIVRNSWQVVKDGACFLSRVTLTAVYDEQNCTDIFSVVVEDISEPQGPPSSLQIENEFEEKSGKKSTASLVRYGNELTEIQRRLLDGRELERFELARELHEGVLQDLYSISYQLQSLVITGMDEALTGEEIYEIQDGIGQVINKLRIFCRELRPPSLVPFGIEKAIRSHAESFQERNPGLQVSLLLSDDAISLPQPVRLALFRIYQQAMQNVVKHAQASQVQVSFLYDAEQVVMEVKDNGKGFEVPERWMDFAKQGKLGLVGAAERSGAIGGSFSVHSLPDQGTTVRVHVPFPGEMSDDA